MVLILELLYGIMADIFTGARQFPFVPDNSLVIIPLPEGNTRGFSEDIDSASCGGFEPGDE